MRKTIVEIKSKSKSDTQHIFWALVDEEVVAKNSYYGKTKEQAATRFMGLLKESNLKPERD